MASRESYLFSVAPAAVKGARSLAGPAVGGGAHFLGRGGGGGGVAPAFGAVKGARSLAVPAVRVVPHSSARAAVAAVSPRASVPAEAAAVRLHASAPAAGPAEVMSHGVAPGWVDLLPAVPAEASALSVVPF